MLEFPYRGHNNAERAKVEELYKQMKNAHFLQYFVNDYRDFVSPVFGPPVQAALIRLPQIDVYCLHACLPYGDEGAGDVVVFHNPNSKEHVVLCGVPKKLDQLVGFRFATALAPICAARNHIAPWNIHFSKLYTSCSKQGRVGWFEASPRCIEEYRALMKPLTRGEVNELVTEIINPAFAGTRGVAETIRVQKPSQNDTKVATRPEKEKAVASLLSVLAQRAVVLDRC